ncbi:PaRep2b protein [Pyrobaculum oguniense TE7]|uniref:PaRep2b protein n=1 Tax=Pyrobaculum oguniense (strain DSM 13380 / JCM 10595 / TE7) TaxID=698757 RepID=H6QCU7_PYROT|nr:PaRep2b protein [Pyrobaculum oguniense TE7]
MTASSVWAALKSTKICRGGGLMVIGICYVLRGEKLTVYFKDGEGNELGRINMGWDGESLRAVFGGAREKAERLASILNALGAKVKARQYGNKWRVELSTDSITAIRRPEWLEAVKALVEELYRCSVIDSRKRDYLLRKLAFGPNVIEIAGVEMSVEWEERAGSEGLKIICQPGSAEAFEAVVKALKEAGFEEGVQFTAKAPKKSKYGVAKSGLIYLKIPASLWRLEELRQQGVGWAEEAVRRLEEMAKARELYHLVEGYLKLAREAESIDPRGMIVEDPERGVKAVIRDVKLAWDGIRPRVVVEYEAGGVVKSFSFTWSMYGNRRIMANVKLNKERAAVLAALTGDNELRRKKRTTLHATHLIALVKIKGVGWPLLKWYAEVKGKPERYKLLLEFANMPSQTGGS